MSLLWWRIATSNLHVLSVLNCFACLPHLYRMQLSTSRIRCRLLILSAICLLNSITRVNWNALQSCYLDRFLKPRIAMILLTSSISSPLCISHAALSNPISERTLSECKRSLELVNERTLKYRAVLFTRLHTGTTNQKKNRHDAFPVILIPSVCHTLFWQFHTRERPFWACLVDWTVHPESIEISCSPDILIAPCTLKAPCWLWVFFFRMYAWELRRTSKSLEAAVQMHSLSPVAPWNHHDLAYSSTFPSSVIHSLLNRSVCDLTNRIFFLHRLHITIKDCALPAAYLHAATSNRLARNSVKCHRFPDLFHAFSLNLACSFVFILKIFKIHSIWMQVSICA